MIKCNSTRLLFSLYFGLSRVGSWLGLLVLKRPRAAGCGGGVPLEDILSCLDLILNLVYVSSL